MNRQIIILCIIISCFQKLEAQQRHAKGHSFRPGISIGYLPAWINESLEDHTKANLIMTGIYGHQEIWKESVLVMGIAYGKFQIKTEEQFAGILLPVKFQKYFTSDRKGFNLGIGVMGNYCKTCNEKGGASLFNEINYLFDVHALKLNVGIQPMIGPLFGDATLYLGGQVQLIWHPPGNKDRN